MQQCKDTRIATLKEDPSPPKSQQKKDTIKFQKYKIAQGEERGRKKRKKK